MSDNNRITLLITMHNNSAQVKRCIENICKYCTTDSLDLVVVDDNSFKSESEWVRNQDYLTYVYFERDEANFAKMINEVTHTLVLKNDFMILNSALWSDHDFIGGLCRIVDGNTDIGTAAPLFPCDVYRRKFNMNEFDENIMEKLKLNSNIYDTIFSQQAALYIRWDCWEQIKGFNEKYYFPYYVIMDFQLKVLKNGYRNIISLENIMRADSDLNLNKDVTMMEIDMFRNDWGIHYLNSAPNKMLTDMVKNIGCTPHNILEVGCAQGDNLMELKNLYPNSELYGLELNPHSVEIAKCFANVVCGNVETDGIPFDTKFDVIIFGDVLEHLRAPEAVVMMCREHLSENGRIVCSIPNVQHISMLNGLIHGMFTYTEVGLLDKTHIHLFTGYEILQMFKKSGYVIEHVAYTLVYISDDEKNAIGKLKNAFPEIDEKQMEAFQYLVCAKKKEG